METPLELQRRPVLRDPLIGAARNGRTVTHGQMLQEFAACLVGQWRIS